jgi:predicted nucleotide-binding protein
MLTSKKDALRRLKSLCDAGEDLTSFVGFDDSKFVKWRRDVRVAINDIFGQTRGHLKEFEEQIQLGEFDTEVFAIERSLPILQSMRDEVNEWPSDTRSGVLVKANTTPKLVTQKKRVFVVHGHDEEMKQAIARVLEQLGLEPVILHEQPDKQRTIIEKFTNYADVCFAIILLSPDDFGFPKNTSHLRAKSRSRQNVILELGYFLGKLGREKVLVIYREDTDFEMPNDYSGVLCTPYDTGSQWKLKLVQELQACNIYVDANKLIKK